MDMYDEPANASLSPILQHFRKIIFMTIIIITALCYAGFYYVNAIWTFVALMSLGTIGFNVGNCVSDAVCFDMLGSGQEMKYGRQRVWGTIGFGVTAFLAGVIRHFYAGSFGPAIIVMLLFTAFDLGSVTQLKLPKMSGSESILNDVIKLVRNRDIAVFLVFATMAGIIDSFIIYFMFWVSVRRDLFT